MASKRPADNKTKEWRNRENYQNYVKASLEVECIDWQEDDNTPLETTTDTMEVLGYLEDEQTIECKHRKLSQKVRN